MCVYVNRAILNTYKVFQNKLLIANVHCLVVLYRRLILQWWASTATSLKIKRERERGEERRIHSNNNHKIVTNSIIFNYQSKIKINTMLLFIVKYSVTIYS